MEEMGFGISVIMPAYNAESTIEEAINSVLSQTYDDFELIIVNDASSDSTVEIVKRKQLVDDRIILINNKKNEGVSYSRHVGVQNAKGRWIAFLDSDDCWDIKKISRQINAQEKTHADLLYTGSAFIDENGNDYKFILHVPNSVTYRNLLKQNIISNSSVLIKKELYIRYESLEDDMHEDFACWLQALREGVRNCGIDEPLLKYRISKKSKSGNKLKAAKMNWKTYRYIGLSRIASIYYMFWYTINGLLKYSKIK